MTAAQHNRPAYRSPEPATGGLLLLLDPSFIWAGARLTSCGFMAAPAAC